MTRESGCDENQAAQQQRPGVSAKVEAASAVPATWPKALPAMAGAPVVPSCGVASPPLQPNLPSRISPASGTSTRPITPDPTPAQASATPATASQQASGAGPAAGAAAAPAAPPRCTATPAAATQQQAGDLWRRVHSFVCCVAESPIIQSALCSLLLRPEDGSGGEEYAPPLPDAADVSDLPAGTKLQLALAQMLALYLRAGYESASEDVLLAVLWVLESFGSAWRSPASVCLAAYLKHLALFSPQLVAEVTADWPASFKSMRTEVVAAQRELLGRVDWRVRLDLDADVRPCYIWLFQAPATWRQLAARLAHASTQMEPGSNAASAAGGPIPAPPAVAWGAWASHLRGLCTRVQQSALLAAPAPAPPSTPSERAGQEPVRCKRQRT